MGGWRWADGGGGGSGRPISWDDPLHSTDGRTDGQTPPLNVKVMNFPISLMFVTPY